MKNISKILSMIWGINKTFFILKVLNAIVSGVMPSIIIWISKNIIDSVVLAIQNQGTSDFFRPVLMWILLELGLVLLNMLFSYFNNYIQSIYRTLISNSVRLDIYLKSISLDMSFFDDESFYDSLTKATREAGQRPIIIVDEIFKLFSILISLGSMLYIFSTFTPLIFVIITATTLPVIFSEIYYSKKGYKIRIGRVNEERESGYWGYLLTDQTTIKEVHLFQLGRYLIENIQLKLDKFLQQDKKFNLSRNCVQFLLQLLSKLALYGHTIYFSYRAILQKITLGDLNMIIAAIGRTQDLLKNFLVSLSSIYESSLFIKDFFQFSEISPVIDQDSNDGLSLDEIREILFDNVWFKYPSTRKYVLRGIDFRISSNEKIALVGKNGSGKSTIIKLLVRLYEPSKGTILINGIDIKKYNIKSLRKQIGVILQDFLHYQVTVKENIGYGDIDDINNTEKIIRAAKKGKALNFISKLPKKLETRLGRLFQKEGHELSIGEWQKIALSRAFMKSASSVLILDEPTASLDIETEYKIFASFQEMIGKKMCILISHRLSTITKSDRIIALKNGKIVVEGSHNELLEFENEYSEMYNLYTKIYKS